MGSDPIYWQVRSRDGAVLCDVGMQLTVEQARNTVDNYRRRDGDDAAYCQPVFPTENGAIPQRRHDMNRDWLERMMDWAATLIILALLAGVFWRVWQ